jgi:hypothetical protein
MAGTGSRKVADMTELHKTEEHETEDGTRADVADPPAYRFDRRVSPELLDALGAGGWLAPLVARRQRDPFVLDLQLRRTARDSPSGVGVHPALASVLTAEVRAGTWRLQAHPTFRAAADFDPAWCHWQEAAVLAGQWDAIDGYLDRVLAYDIVVAAGRPGGRVQTLMSAGASRDYQILQRAAAVSFRDHDTRQATLGGIRERILAALASSGPTARRWPGGEGGEVPNLRSEVDLVGIDPAGRLLVIDVHPAESTKAIAFAPAQVTLSAELFARLLASDPDAVDHLDGMLSQRRAVGLAAAGSVLHRPVRVSPVVAIAAGTISADALRQLAAVHDALSSRKPDSRVDPLEVWLLDGAGRIGHRWLPGREPLIHVEPEHTTPGGPASFRDRAREAAAEWKQRTTTFPSFARQPDTYQGVAGGRLHDFCFPVQLADLNLLPEARATALERFATAKIGWHRGTNGMPSNHLLSSQVQCVNTLAPLVDRPAAIKQIFGGVLPIAEVLPFGAALDDPHALDDHVVFTWVGLVDHLGEWRGGPAARGAGHTGADAAFRYRTPDGATELALVVWKYHEQYQGHELGGGPHAAALRAARYRPVWDDPAGPLRRDRIPYTDLFVEPFYQLMRLQMLAWRMERAGELGASAVRLVVVAPAANLALAESWSRPTHRMVEHAGLTPPATVWETWRLVLADADRFAVVDSATLVTPEAPTSAEWRDRYGHLAAPPRRVPARAGAVGVAAR